MQLQETVCQLKLTYWPPWAGKCDDQPLSSPDLFKPGCLAASYRRVFHLCLHLEHKGTLYCQKIIFVSITGVIILWMNFFHQNLCLKSLLCSLDAYVCLLLQHLGKHATINAWVLPVSLLLLCSAKKKVKQNANELFTNKSFKGYFWAHEEISFIQSCFWQSGEQAIITCYQWASLPVKLIICLFILTSKCIKCIWTIN